MRVCGRSPKVEWLGCVRGFTWRLAREWPTALPLAQATLAAPAGSPSGQVSPFGTDAAELLRAEDCRSLASFRPT